MLCSWLAVILATVAAAQLPEATAVLSPELLGLSELAELRVTVRGPGLEAIDPPRFLLDNLKIVAGPETAVGARDAGGGRVFVFRWLLRPQHLGPARVYGLRVSAAGRRLELPVRRLTAQALPTGHGARPPARVPSSPSGAPGAGAASGGTGAAGTRANARPAEASPDEASPDEASPEVSPDASRAQPSAGSRVFLRAEARPERPWRGQQVQYTLYLYYQTDVRSIRPVELPSFDGFWAEEISVPGQPTGEPSRVGGETFERAVMLRRALFPLRAGPVEIDPVTAEMIAAGPGGDRGRLLKRRSNTLTLEVRELPEPTPRGFTGAVGELELETRLEPAKAIAGQAVAWVAVLEGDGRLGLVELPAPELGAGLSDAGTDEPRTEREVTGGKIRQRRTWHRWLVPERAGRFRLPPVEIPYFDPAAGEYRRLQAKPEDLLVTAGDGSRRSTVPPAERPEREDSASRWGFPWKALSLALLALALAAALFLTEAGRQMRAGWRVRLERGRDPHRRVLEREVDTALALPTAAAAAAAVETAWRRYLAHRRPELEPLAPREWSPALRRRRLAAAAEAAQRFAEDLDFLRRAPHLADAEALKNALARQSRRLADQLG